jgi:hypothetical protein
MCLEKWMEFGIKYLDTKQVENDRTYSFLTLTKMPPTKESASKPKV